MLRDRVIQALVIGVVAGGVGAGFITLINTGFKSDDVFAFAGAIIGAAATVAGSVWLSDRSVKREQRAEQSLIVEDLQDLHQIAIAAAASDPKGGEWTDKWKSDMNALTDVARGARRFLDEVITSAKTLNFHQRERVKLVHQALDGFISFHDDVFSEGEIEHWDERTWTSQIEPVARETSYCLVAFRRPAASRRLKRS
jgi:hypothetical protein